MSFRKDNAARQTEIRRAMLDNGYTPLANNHKHCYIEGWGEIEVTHDLIDEWSRKLAFQATGLRVENGVCGIDVDIDDADVVEEVWKRSIAKHPQLREALIRFGSGAKEMWLVRTDEMFSVATSTGHSKPGTDLEKEDVAVHRIEAFGGGHNRQLGVFGAHTMNEKGDGFEIEYVWDGEDTPETVLASALPLVPKSAVIEICQIASDVMIERDWPQDRRSKVGEISTATVYDLTDDMTFDCIDGVLRNLEELKEYALHRNARCSASWTGDAALKNRTRCLISLDHTGEVCVLETSSWVRHMAAKLADREIPTGDKAAKLGERLRDAGYEFDHDTYHDAPPDFQQRVLQLLDEWAWCGPLQRPCLPVRGHPDAAMTLNNLRITELRYAYEREGPRGGVVRINPVDAWVIHSAREDVDGYRFMPDKPPGIFTTSDGVRAINSYHAPHHTAPHDDVAASYDEIWTRFLEHLLPDPGERKWFTNWLAYKKQHLTTPGVGVIMYAPLFGVGRGTLFDIIGGVFGERYVRNVSADTLMGKTQQSQYSDWMAESLFVTTDEVLPDGDDGMVMSWRRKKAYEKLKERIDPKPRMMEIVRKTLGNYQDWVYTTFLLATNHDNAIPFPKGDRRLTVLSNGLVPLAQSGPLYGDLNALRGAEWGDRFRPDFIAFVADWLDNYDVSKSYNPHAPLDTKAKSEMLEANIDEFDSFVDDIISDLPHEWVALDAFLRRVEMALIRRDMKDSFPSWRRNATDRLQERWVRVGRARVGSSKEVRALIFASSYDAAAMFKDTPRRDKDAAYADMIDVERGASAKLRALRQGLKDVS